MLTHDNSENRVWGRGSIHLYCPLIVMHADFPTLHCSTRAYNHQSLMLFDSAGPEIENHVKNLLIGAHHRKSSISFRKLLERSENRGAVVNCPRHVSGERPSIRRLTSCLLFLFSPPGAGEEAARPASAAR